MVSQAITWVFLPILDLNLSKHIHMGVSAENHYLQVRKRWKKIYTKKIYLLNQYTLATTTRMKPILHRDMHAYEHNLVFCPMKKLESVILMDLFKIRCSLLSPKAPPSLAIAENVYFCPLHFFVLLFLLFSLMWLWFL